jgi:hypothetical protein
LSQVHPSFLRVAQLSIGTTANFTIPNGLAVIASTADAAFSLNVCPERRVMVT